MAISTSNSLIKKVWSVFSNRYRFRIAWSSQSIVIDVLFVVGEQAVVGHHEFPPSGGAVGEVTVGLVPLSSSGAHPQKFARNVIFG